MNLDELAHKHDVASLELSKELKEKGVPQDKSLWYWKNGTLVNKENRDFTINDPRQKDVIIYAALHSGELAEILPNRIRRPDDDYYLKITKLKHGGWDMRYMAWRSRLTYDGVDGIIQADTLPNAFSELVLYLLEKEIIKKGEE